LYTRTRTPLHSTMIGWSESAVILALVQVDGPQAWPWAGCSRWRATAGHGRQVGLLLGMQSAHAAASSSVICPPTEHSNAILRCSARTQLCCLLASNQLCFHHSHKTKRLALGTLPSNLSILLVYGISFGIFHVCRSYVEMISNLHFDG